MRNLCYGIVFAQNIKSISYNEQFTVSPTCGNDVPNKRKNNKHVKSEYDCLVENIWREKKRAQRIGKRYTHKEFEYPYSTEGNKNNRNKTNQQAWTRSI